MSKINDHMRTVWPLLTVIADGPAPQILESHTNVCFCCKPRKQAEWTEDTLRSVGACQQQARVGVPPQVKISAVSGVLEFHRATLHHVPLTNRSGATLTAVAQDTRRYSPGATGKSPELEPNRASARGRDHKNTVIPHG